MFKTRKAYEEAIIQYNHPLHKEAMEIRKQNMSKLKRLGSPFTDRTERALWANDISKAERDNIFQ